MSIWILAGGHGAQSYYRRQLPAKFLSKHGFRVKCSDDLTERDVKDNKVFVFGGLIRPGFLETITMLKTMGKKVVYEIDDDIWHVPEWNPAANVFTNEAIDTINWTVNEAHDVIVTTDALRKIIGKGTVLPNLVDLDDWPNITRLPKSEIRILWAGSIHHLKDLEELVKPVEAILDKYPCVKMFFMGDMPSQMAEFIRIQHSHLGMLVPAARYKGQVKFIHPVALNQYWQTLCDIEPDIALLPLNDHSFNDSKSSIKYYEMVLAGAVCVASDRPPYACCKYRTGQRDTEGWVNHLSELIEDEERRQKEAVENYQQVEKLYSWQNSENVSTYLDFFRRLDD